MKYELDEWVEWVGGQVENFFPVTEIRQNNAIVLRRGYQIKKEPPGHHGNNLHYINIKVRMTTTPFLMISTDNYDAWHSHLK
jgi:hypothetical protein